MSIATEQKVEELLKRVGELERDLAALRQEQAEAKRDEKRHAPRR